MTFQMTPRRFANLSAKNASSHLKVYAAYLANQACLKPILAHNSMPEETFKACQEALFRHWMKAKTDESQALLEKSKTIVSGSSRYLVKVYGIVDEALAILQVKHHRILDNGKIEMVMKPMEYTAKDYSSAERLADRRLFERSDAVFADISNTNGKTIQTRVERRDAVARVLVRPKHPVMKGMKRSSSLKWQPKSRASRNTTQWNIVR